MKYVLGLNTNGVHVEYSLSDKHTLSSMSDSNIHDELNVFSMIVIPVSMILVRRYG